MEIADSVKKYLTREIALLQSSEDVDENASLMKSGLLDSIDVIKLVSFLERSFEIAIDAQDVKAGHLETVTSIARFVRARISG